MDIYQFITGYLVITGALLILALGIYHFLIWVDERKQAKEMQENGDSRDI